MGKAEREKYKKYKVSKETSDYTQKKWRELAEWKKNPDCDLIVIEIQELLVKWRHQEPNSPDANKIIMVKHDYQSAHDDLCK